MIVFVRHTAHKLQAVHTNMGGMGAGGGVGTGGGSHIVKPCCLGSFETALVHTGVLRVSE